MGGRSGAHAAPRRVLALSSSGRHRAGATPRARLGTGAALLLVGSTVAVVATGAPSTGSPVQASAVQASAVLASAVRAAGAAPAASPSASGSPTALVAAAARAQQRGDRDRLPPRTLVPAPPSPTPPPPPVLPGCTDDVVARAQQVEAGGYANGALPDDVLCPAVGSPDERLRADAALALVPLAEAYRARFGEPICVSDGYRPLGEQQVLQRTRARYAAPVGTSVHGWGTAVDVACGVNSFGSERHAWMRENAPRYGWDLPEWARVGGSNPEPWHWEYVGR